MDAIARFFGVNKGTPLQKKLSGLAILPFCDAVLCAIIVLAANKFVAREEVVIYAVATGLSMILPSLGAVLSTTMAASTKRMAQRNIIGSSEPAIVGGAGCQYGYLPRQDYLASTLTQGRMVVRRAWIPATGTYTVTTSSELFNPTASENAFRRAPTGRGRLREWGSRNRRARATGPAFLPASKKASSGCGVQLANLARHLCRLETGHGMNARKDPTARWQSRSSPSRFDRKPAQASEPDRSWTAELPFGWDDAKRMYRSTTPWGQLFRTHQGGAVERRRLHLHTRRPRHGTGGRRVTSGDASK